MGHCGPRLSAVVADAVPRVWSAGPHSGVRCSGVLPRAGDLRAASHRHKPGTTPDPRHARSAADTSRQYAVLYLYVQAGPGQSVPEVSDLLVDLLMYFKTIPFQQGLMISMLWHPLLFVISRGLLCTDNFCMARHRGKYRLGFDTAFQPVQDRLGKLTYKELCIQRLSCEFSINSRMANRIHHQFRRRKKSVIDIAIKTVMRHLFCLVYTSGIFNRTT